jgi:diaminopropionate ammonia-lyase
VVVEPVSADCLFQSALQSRPANATGNLETIMAGLSCGETSPIAWQILGAGADAFLTIPDAAAAHAMRVLAYPEGARTSIVAGESGAAGLAGFLAAASDPEVRASLQLSEESRILLIGTEGATDPQSYASIVGKPARR